jgi:hypothetical protein
MPTMVVSPAACAAITALSPTEPTPKTAILPEVGVLSR